MQTPQQPQQPLDLHADYAHATQGATRLWLHHDGTTLALIDGQLLRIEPWCGRDGFLWASYALRELDPKG